jgi:hypothetical protein
VRALLVVVLAAALVWIVRVQDARYDLRGAVRALYEKPVDPASFERGRPLVLFIGNSLTYVNDLPTMFARLARSLGSGAGVRSYAPGGQTFEGHLKDPSVAKMIAEGDWDYVVLQEQSQRPAFGDEQVERETMAPMLRLAELVHAARPRARLAFYETWGRRDGDAENCKEIPAVCTYAGQQARLNAAYEAMARRAPGVLVPVGAAWRAVRAAHPELVLYQADGVHPASAGTYLAACVFYAALTGKSPVGADALGLPEKDARILQEAAAAASR